MKNKSEIIKLLSGVSDRRIEFAQDQQDQQQDQQDQQSGGVTVEWTNIPFKHRVGGQTVTDYFKAPRITATINTPTPIRTFQEILANATQATPKTYQLTLDSGLTSAGYDFFNFGGESLGWSQGGHLQVGNEGGANVYLAVPAGTRTFSSVPSSDAATVLFRQGSPVWVAGIPTNLEGLVAACIRSVEPQIEQLYKDIFGDLNNESYRPAAWALRMVSGIDLDTAKQIFRTMVRRYLTETLFTDESSGRVETKPEYMINGKVGSREEIESAVKQYAENIGKAMKTAVSTAFTSLAQYLNTVRDSALKAMKGKENWSSVTHPVRFDVVDQMQVDPSVEIDKDTSDREMLQNIIQGKVTFPTRLYTYVEQAVAAPRASIGQSGEVSWSTQAWKMGVRPQTSEEISYILDVANQGLNLLEKYGASMAESTTVPDIEKAAGSIDWEEQATRHGGLASIPKIASEKGIPLSGEPTAESKQIRREMKLLEPPAAGLGAALMAQLRTILFEDPHLKSALGLLPSEVGDFLTRLFNLIRTGKIKFAALPEDQQAQLASAVDKIYNTLQKMTAQA